MISEFGGAAEVEEAEEELSTDEKVEEPEAAPLPTKALMQEEERITGAVSGSVYRQYLTAANGKLTVPLLLGSLALMQGTQVFGSYWLVYWQEDAFNRPQSFYVRSILLTRPRTTQLTCIGFTDGNLRRTRSSPSSLRRSDGSRNRPARSDGLEIATL